MNLNLVGKRVVVTAGAGGIGLEIAKAFAGEGAQVQVCDVDANAVAILGQQDGAIGGAVCDISDRAAVERFVAEAARKLGGIDVLVNNAGIGGPTSPLAEVDAKDWQRVMEVNVLGTFHVTQCCLPYLRKNQDASIIMMSSLAGRLGYANRSAYAASKWALIGLAKTLAIELGGDGIRVNAVLPGAVDGTRLQAVFQGRAQASGRTLEEEVQAAMRNQSIKKLTQPADIAALVCFLASPQAASISGQALPIDGDTQAI